MDLVEGPRPADDNKPMMLAHVDAAAVPELRAVCEKIFITDFRGERPPPFVENM